MATQKETQMAVNPIPDHVPSMMEKDFGTVVLITDPKADKYLNSRKVQPKDKHGNK